MAKRKRLRIVLIGAALVVVAIFAFVPAAFPREPRFIKAYEGSWNHELLPYPAGGGRIRYYEFNVAREVLLAAMKKELVPQGWVAYQRGSLSWEFVKGNESYAVYPRTLKSPPTEVSYSYVPSWQQRMWEWVKSKFGG